jgi:hypothetical protein
MNDTFRQLKTIFGLPSSASDAQLISTARRSAGEAAAAAEKREEQALVNNMIYESVGALDERSARQVIKNRAMFATSKKAKI